VKQADVVLAAPGGGLIEADVAHLREVLSFARPLDVVVEDAPDAHVAHPQQAGHLAHRHGSAQGDDERLHERRETALRPRPRHLDLRGLAAGRALYPRHLDMQIGVVLEEIQMPPLPLSGVVHRLMFGPTLRTGEARPGGTADSEIDAPSHRIEADIEHLPRRRQPQCGSEQRGRWIHGLDFLIRPA